LALLAMALVVTLTLEMTLAAASMTARMRNQFWHEQHYQHLVGAETRAVQRLQDWFRQEGVVPPIADHLDAVYELPEGGRVELIVRDWKGRFNINWLASGRQGRIS